MEQSWVILLTLFFTGLSWGYGIMLWFLRKEEAVTTVEELSTPRTVLSAPSVLEHLKEEEKEEEDDDGSNGIAAKDMLVVVQQEQEAIHAQSEPCLPVVVEEHPWHPQHCPRVTPLTGDQLHKVAQLRKRVEDEGFMIDYFCSGDETIWPRFLRANKWDVAKAAQGMRVLSEFRQTLGPITPELRRLISLGNKTGVYNIVPSRDLYGRVVLYICLRRHNPAHREVDKAFRCIIWFLDLFFSRHVLKTHYAQVWDICV